MINKSKMQASHTINRCKLYVYIFKYLALPGHVSLYLGPFGTIMLNNLQFLTIVMTIVLKNSQLWTIVMTIVIS